MSDPFRQTEEAEDARHNTPPLFPDVEPDRPNPFYQDSHFTETGPGIELPERGKSQAYVPASLISQLPDPPTMTWGLQFLDNGRVFSDLGRWSKRTELDDIDTLDLRVILAHLDSAAMAIKAALDQRYGAGR